MNDFIFFDFDMIAFEGIFICLNGKSVSALRFFYMPVSLHILFYPMFKYSSYEYV